ncbi:MAG TPA: hypothetical protein VNN73_05750 [Blastocatellia bacterium]|nr:hypothetical protein [Blastocatellia bacterium]
MRLSSRAIKLSALALLLAFPIASSGQWDKKPYTEWSEKETMKLLNNSPWCQTQSFTDTTRTASTTRSGAGQTTAIAETITVNFRVRFLSAKTVRQAISRYMELQQKEKLSEQMAVRLKAFASADFPDFVVVTVTVDSDRASNMLQEANSLLTRLTTAQLKNNTYLQASGGERVFLQEYQPPRNDGLGARFVFPRTVDGKPIIASDAGEIVFHAELSGGSALNSTVPNSDIPNRDASGRTAQPIGFTLNTRHKIKEMAFAGKIEY